MDVSSAAGAPVSGVPPPPAQALSRARHVSAEPSRHAFPSVICFTSFFELPVILSAEHESAVNGL